MGNCCRPFGLIRRYSSRIRHKKIVLLLVGLDNAGKSSAARGLSKEPVEDVVPTVGFNSVKLVHRGFEVIIYDLGGGSQIRDIWYRYFADVHGVIFVVDASDRERLDECKKVLEELLVNDKLAGKPVLLLANKQDKEGALDELDVVERLNVERLVNLQQCPTLVETCSAATPSSHGKKRKLDPGIDNGYRWLMRRIIGDFDNLNGRVMRDQEAQKVAMEIERAARKKRLKEERKARGEGPSDEDSASESPEEMSNPFQPIHILVQEKEKQVKRRKEIVFFGSSERNGKTNDVIDLESPPRTVTNHSNQEDDAHNEINAVDGVREQFKQKSASQRRKRNFMKKTNKTAPSPECLSPSHQERVASPEEGFVRKYSELPPIRNSQVTWAQISSNGKANGVVTESRLWDLEKSLDVMVAPNGIISRPESAGSDAKDVVSARR